VSRGAVLRSAVCCAVKQIKMFRNGTLVLSADPWSFWGKPTGNGPEAVTVEPNVGPPDKRPDQPEEPLSSLEQMLARIEEMRRAQAEENRQFLEALQDPPARRPTPIPRDPLALQNPDPQDPAEMPTRVPRDPSALLTPDPRVPSAAPATPAFFFFFTQQSPLKTNSVEVVRVSIISRFISGWRLTISNASKCNFSTLPFCY